MGGQPIILVKSILLTIIINQDNRQSMVRAVSFFFFFFFFYKGASGRGCFERVLLQSVPFVLQLNRVNNIP